MKHLITMDASRVIEADEIRTGVLVSERLIAPCLGCTHAYVSALPEKGDTTVYHPVVSSALSAEDAYIKAGMIEDSIDAILASTTH